jgi:hypothetical protein
LTVLRGAACGRSRPFNVEYLGIPIEKIGWLMTALFALFMLAGSAAPELIGAQVATDAMTAIRWGLKSPFNI